jgi:NADH:ubiquinone oxidoreductase subunit F (NADH-binding)
VPPARRRPAEQLIAAIDQAGLKGRGGAGFPTAKKMRAVASGKRRPIVLANGSEGEPASRKDELLMSAAPHLVLDGAVLSAAAVGADEVIVAVASPDAHKALQRAARERFDQEPATAKIRVVAVPDRYIAGEERSVVNMLNGGQAIPTSGDRPFERGVAGRPTLVQNVETLAHIALIGRFGPDWFRQVGTPETPGTMLTTVSGGVGRPGVYEIAMGTSLTQLLDAAQGTPSGIGSVLVGGYAGTWLTPGEVTSATLDSKDLAQIGGALGCGIVAVLPQGACGVGETAAVMKWMAENTAGQCGPCVHGLAAIAGVMQQLRKGAGGAASVSRLSKWAGDIEGRGACRYPDGAIRMLRSALRTFSADVEQHAAGRPCRSASMPAILPLPAVAGAA